MSERISVGMAALPNRPHALYRFFDRSDVLLYVGITANLTARINKHRADKPWWLQVDHIAIEHFETRRAALDAETKAIRVEQPLYNVQHNEEAPMLGHSTAWTATRRALAKEFLGAVFGVLDFHPDWEEEAAQMAAEDLELIGEDRTFPDEDDPEVLAALMLVHVVAGRMLVRESSLVRFLNQLPDDLKASALDDVRDAYEKAGEPFPLYQEDIAATALWYISEWIKERC